MSKVLKIAGAVLGAVAIVASGGLAAIGVAAFSVAGISGGMLSLVAAGMTLGSSLLSQTQKSPATSPATDHRLHLSSDLRAPRTIVLGETAMATDERDREYTDGQTFLHRFVVVASHKVAAIREIWFDDKLAWTAAGGVQGEFAGYLAVTPILEGSAANAINISPRMGSTRRFTGLAYVHLRYKLTGNSKKTESPFASAIPSRVTIIGKGALVYDPRRDSSRGGSGSQRVDDQNSWAWDDSASRNLALQTLWWLLGWRIQNPVTGEWKLAVGKGIPPARIDFESFITGANLCDELVARAAGGTEPRYRGDGIFSEDDDPQVVLDSLKAAMNATIDDVDGKIRLTVLHNDLATPTAPLTTDDVIGAFRWKQTVALSESFNVVRGSFTDPSTASLYQQPDYPEVRIPSPDGIDRELTVNLPLVQSPSQAQRLAKQRLRRSLYPGTFSAVFQATAWAKQKGDVFPFTFAPLGWTNKLFRVVDIAVQVDGQVPMVIREEHPDIYADDATDAAPIAAAAANRYDYKLAAIYQDIQQPSGPDGTPLVDLIAAASAANSKWFFQPTPPSAAESKPGDFWVNSAAGNLTFARMPGSGRVSIGGNAITLAGNAIALCWTEASDQRVGAAFANSLTAIAIADTKAKGFVMLNASDPEPVGEGVGDVLFRLYLNPAQTDTWTGSAWIPSATFGATGPQAASIIASQNAIAAIVSDDVLSKGEKGAFKLEWAKAQARYGPLDTKAATFGGVAALRSTLTAKYSALALAIAAITPPYGDVDQDSPLGTGGGDALRTKWADFYAAYTALDLAITAVTRAVEWSVDGLGGWHAEFAGGDKWQRESVDGGATWSAAFKVVGEDGSDGIDGKFPSFVYKRAATQPDTPTDAVTPPAGWSDAPPAQVDPPQPLWQSKADFRNADKLTAWSAPVKLIAASLLDLDPAASALLTQARDIALGKNRIFRGPTAPRAADSQENDYWINTAAGERTLVRVPGSGRLAIGGKTITLAGNAIELCWTETKDARLGQALEQAALAIGKADAAQATATAAGVRLSAYDNDGILTPVEKHAMRDDVKRLEESWTALDALAAAQGVTTARTATAAARTAFAAQLAAIVPAWDNTDLDSAISRTTYQAALDDFEKKLAGLHKATTASAAETASWSLVADNDGTKPEPNADVTAQNQVLVEVAEIPVNADSAGTVTTPLPIVRTPSVTRGPNDIRTDNATTYALANLSANLAPGGVAKLSVNNTAGSADKGKLTLVTGFTGSGTADLTVTVSGVARTVKVSVTVKRALPPTGGGTGSTSATGDLGGKGAGDTTYVEVFRASGITITAGQTIKCEAAGDYDLSTFSGSSPTSSSMSGRWRYAPAGSGSFTDIAAAVSGSPASYRPIDGDATPGSIACNQNQSGLSAGAFDIVFQVSRSTGTPAGNLTFSAGSIRVYVA